MTDVHVLILDSASDADRLHEFRRELGDIWGKCRSLQSVVVRGRFVTVPGMKREGIARWRKLSDGAKQKLVDAVGDLAIGSNAKLPTAIIAEAVLCEVDAICDERDAAVAQVQALTEERDWMRGRGYGRQQGKP